MEKLLLVLKVALSYRILPIWLTALILGFTVHGFSWDDIYIWRTREHTKCKFPDGSFTEYKTTYKWLFYAAPIPHAQSRKEGETIRRYVDADGVSHQEIALYGGGDCRGIGKKDGRFVSRAVFENKKGKLIRLADEVGTDVPSWKTLPKPIPVGTVDQDKEIQKFMNDEFLFAGEWYISILPGADSHLLVEQPFTSLNHPSIPHDVVRYVYQAESIDFGKTWSIPKITTEAKFFEIGKPLDKQSWAPKIEKITGDFVPRWLDGKFLK
jgi:hypothetical protein